MYITCLGSHDRGGRLVTGRQTHTTRLLVTAVQPFEVLKYEYCDNDTSVWTP